MNKDLIKRLIVVAAILALATASLVAGTFAKYTTEIAGEATARVAKFDVKAVLGSGGEGAATFGLFDTILDTFDGEEEEDVLKTGSDGKTLIAPGTKGSFEIELENNSEVTVDYDIVFTGDLKNVPLEFRIYEGDEPEDDDAGWIIMGTPNEDEGMFGLGDLNGNGTFQHASAPEEITYTVEWRWLFEKGTGNDLTTNDEYDTALGTATSPAEPTVTATVTFTQVD